MIDKEKEFKKVFYFCKKSAKSPLTPSYTIGYSRGNFDKEPAQKIYSYIISLQSNTSVSFEEKINTLYDFIERSIKDEEEESKLIGRMGNSGFYRNFIYYIDRSKKDIKEGKPVQTRRK